MADPRAARSFWCHQCNHMVMVTAGRSILCPCCGGGFLEEAAAGGAAGGNTLAVTGWPRTAPSSGGLFDFLEAMLRRGSADGRTGGGVLIVRAGDLDGPRFYNGRFGDFTTAGPGFEQLIQQLLENDPAGNYGTPPASRAEIDAMPTIKITREHLRGDTGSCAVCKDEFSLGSEVKQMPCKHVYHENCILPWLSLHGSCPVCRYEVGSAVPRAAAPAAPAAAAPASRPGHSSNRLPWFFRRRH